jgi:UDP-xylose:glucoside alpha-1,3-xylosyltransferase
MEPSFPEKNNEEWRRLFKLCASQRIFLPEILPTIDSLLYVDTDVLFLDDIKNIYNHFKLFNKTQIAALAPEHEWETMGWYNRFARHPYYGKMGLNSGVMLMNLTRMRSFNFIEKMLPFYETYKYNITWGDQCLLNILFHFYPETLYVYDCSWNYRPDHCMYGQSCREAEVTGARILHGCRRVFMDESKQPAFRVIYKLFEEYQFNDELKGLITKLNESFENRQVADTYCGKSKNIFENQLKRHELTIKYVYL